MNNSLELRDEMDTILRGYRIPNSDMIQIRIQDHMTAKYLLSAEERRTLAMFLLDGLKGGDADSAKTKLTGAEYAELSSLISRNALNQAISAAENITTTRVDHAIDAIRELYDQLG